MQTRQPGPHSPVVSALGLGAMGMSDLYGPADRAESLATLAAAFEADITLIDTPKLDLYRGTELPWKVTSQRAEVSPGGVEVELIDDVRIARTDAKNRPTIITSSRMTVIPDKEYAQTEQAVRIVAANGVTTAQGMKAYLNDGRMLLQSNVRGQHEVR